MTVESLAASAPAAAVAPRAMRLAFVSAFLGWMFDAMDLSVITLILFPSISELAGTRNPATVAQIGGFVIAITLAGWGLGGIVFGVVADRIGRARTMIITILIYSLFTGLTGLVTNLWQFALLQALAGVGIGGEWAAGAALIAETWPERSRARALQLNQMAFALGFFVAAAVNYGLGPISWRWVVVAGVAPALLTIFIRRSVPEPARWVAARARSVALRGSGMATFAALFRPPVLRLTLVGVIISSAFMVGSWGGSNLVPTWINHSLGPGQARRAVETVSIFFMLMNVGAVCGYLSLVWLYEAIGRRWSYVFFAAGALAISLFLFAHERSPGQIEALALVYGYFAIGGFGSFACYLPELFPTAVRASGQGFCWNVSRIITGLGTITSGTLVGWFGSVPAAAFGISFVIVFGLIAIWFGPETRGMPLAD